MISDTTEHVADAQCVNQNEAQRGGLRVTYCYDMATELNTATIGNLPAGSVVSVSVPGRAQPFAITFDAGGLGFSGVTEDDERPSYEKPARV